MQTNTMGAPGGLHLDANDFVHFQRELEYIRANETEVKRQPLMVKQLVPVDYSVPAHAEEVRYKQWDQVGVARLISSYADDLPRVDVKAKEFSAKVRTGGDAFGYSIFEIRASVAAGTRLEQRRAGAARRAWDELVERIGTKGDTEFGSLGLINQPNATQATAANGAGGVATWTTGATPKTPDEIIKDLNRAANSIVSLTRQVEIPDTILLPQDHYAHIASTPRSATSDTTILEFFLKSNPYIKTVIPWMALLGAGAGGTNRMIAYKRSPEVLQLVIPQELLQLPPEQRNLEYVVNCVGRIAGVVAYLPLAIYYLDGI